MKGRLIASIIVIITVVTGAVSCLGKGDKADALPKTVSFNFHIRPILSDKCFKCHGPDRLHTGRQVCGWILPTALLPR